ncbi:MAG: SPOR domain-containing protein [Acidobacteriota bacterium]
MTDWSETGYHEIRLEQRQLAVVFFIAAGIGIVLFLLGVMVGRKSAGASSPVPATVEKVEAAQPKPMEKEPAASFFEKTGKPEVPETGKRPAEDVASAAPSAPPTADVKPQPAKSTGHTYSLQAGAFSTEANAKKAAQEMEKAGYPIRILAPGDKDKKKLYRVFVGEFATRDEVMAAKKRMEEMGFKNLVPK